MFWKKLFHSDGRNSAGLPVESPRMYSLFIYYFFTKPDNIFTSNTEWLVFPESTALNNQYFVNTSCSVEESCGSTFCIHTIENKEERIVLVQSATLHMVVCL